MRLRSCLLLLNDLEGGGLTWGSLGRVVGYLW